MNNDALLALDPTACTLAAGELSATFLPGRGMLGASLRHRGEELLGRVEDLAAAAQAGSTCGIPLLYPWANRLGGLRYQAAGRTVELTPGSPLLHFDGSGLPMHGVPWAQLAWGVSEQATDRVKAWLDWRRTDLLAVFPFPHRLEMTATLRPDGLTVEATLCADQASAVPVSFGFHPYFRLPGLPRAAWQINLPTMSRLLLEDRGIPTGEEAPAPAFDAKLGDRAFDDGFALLDSQASFSISGNGRRITVEFVEGYAYAQVYAPRGKDFVAFEPMTAPTNALVSGRGLRLVKPGDMFRATFRVTVQEVS